MLRFIAAAKPKGISVCKQRRAMGKDGLASSVNLLLPDAEKTGKLTSIRTLGGHRRYQESEVRALIQVSRS